MLHFEGRYLHRVPLNGKASFTVDLDGFVFGDLDPDPVTYGGSFSSDGAVADDFILPLLQSVFS